MESAFGPEVFINPAATGYFQFTLKALDSARQHESSKLAICNFQPFWLTVHYCGVIFNSRDLILKGKSHSVPLFAFKFQEHVPLLSGFISCHNRMTQVDSTNCDNPIWNRRMKTGECNLKEQRIKTCRATHLCLCNFTFTASADTLTSEFCLHRCFCNGCTPYQYLFLYAKHGVYGQIWSLLITQWKIAIEVTLTKSSYHFKSARSGHSLRLWGRGTGIDRSKVACLGQIVTVACDLGDQSLTTSCQVTNSYFRILLPAMWPVTVQNLLQWALSYIDTN